MHVTTLDMVRRPPVQVAIWPVVAFAAFAVAGLRAMMFALGHAGPAPTFDEILGLIDWQGAVFRAIAWSAPAGIVALVQARFDHVRYLRSPLVSPLILLLIALLAATALLLAYQVGPQLAHAAQAA
jgi:hypothetical protein